MARVEARLLFSGSAIFLIRLLDLQGRLGLKRRPGGVPFFRGKAWWAYEARGLKLLQFFVIFLSAAASSSSHHSRNAPLFCKSARFCSISTMENSIDARVLDFVVKPTGIEGPIFSRNF